MQRRRHARRQDRGAKPVPEAGWKTWMDWKDVALMPWSNQGGGGPWGGGNGGGGGGGGPWGQGPRGGGGGGGGGQQPPNLEDLLRRGQDRFRRFLPGNMGGRGIILLILVVIAVWLASGFYRVNSDEQGVVLRFGKWVSTTLPGLNYHWPWPVETVLTPKVTQVRRTEIGLRTGAEAVGARMPSGTDVPEESLMLTGDENIVDVDFSVLWVIKDAGNYLFNVENPPGTVKDVAESAMREVIGKNEIQQILTEGRRPIEAATRELMQKILDGYEIGVQVTQVNLQKVDPPAAVIEAFRDVQAAQADRERKQNEAQAYANDIIPRARGEAQRLEQQARAYKKEVTDAAEGEAARFLSVYNEYVQARDVTTRRLYLETMQKIMSGTDKMIITQPENGGQGVVPYLPLDELRRPGSGSSSTSRQGAAQ